MPGTGTMVPAPTGLPTIVRVMPSSALRSIIPSMSARLAGIGNFLNSSGEVTCPCTSMVIESRSVAGRAEHLPAILLDGSDHRTEVGEAGGVERGNLQPLGGNTGLDEPVLVTRRCAENQEARGVRLDLVRVRDVARQENRAAGRDVEHLAAHLDAQFAFQH